MKYKAIVFDYGGVLVINSHAKKRSLLDLIADELQIPVDDLRSEFFRHNHLSNVGNLPWIEVCLRAVAVFDDSKETAQKVLELEVEFDKLKVVNEELIAHISKLRAAGYITAILSNYSSALKGVLAEHKIDHVFDHVFVSGELGTQKPDPRAFQAVCEALNIEPSEMVFIDDTPRSLETAAEVGYTPILFRSNEQLFSDFEKLGV